MAKYEVLAETLGSNPTYSKGDIIEDSGALAAPFDFGWLERNGAIQKVGAETARELDPDKPSDVQHGTIDDPEAARSSAERGEIVPLSGESSTGPEMVIAPSEAAGSEQIGPSDLSAVELDDDQRKALADAGIRTADDVRVASDEQLRAIKGVGPATLLKLREATKA